MNFKIPRILSGNALKIIAAISMFIDHFGFMFFPNIQIFRIIGRLAFPIFAFMISEGTKYTRNKTKYFLSVFSVGVICFLAYFITNGKIQFSIFITFTLSLLMIFTLDEYKSVAFSTEANKIIKLTKFILFALSVAFSYVFCELFYVDYGFTGAATPLAASLVTNLPEFAPKSLKRMDKLSFRVALLTVPLIILAVDLRISQPYALFSIPLLLLYSEKRGKLKLKYFFYVFYPLHLSLLEGVRIIIRILE